MQDHNKDYIVEFPDWDPSTDNQRDAHEFVKRPIVIDTQPSRRFLYQSNERFFLHEASSSLPQPHLWYNNRDAVHALKLFLDAGSELSEIPTYR